MKRTGINIILLISLFMLPWWATIVCAVIGFLSFDFYEGIFWGAFLDMWWFRESDFLWNNIFLLGAVILYIVTYFFKNTLKI